MLAKHMDKHVDSFWVIWPIFIVFSVWSCALTQKDMEEKRITSAYQKIYVVDHHYKKIMTAASDMYRHGLLFEDEKEAIIRQGQIVYNYQRIISEQLLHTRKKVDAGLIADEDFEAIESYIPLLEKELLNLHSLADSLGVL